MDLEDWVSEENKIVGFVGKRNIVLNNYVIWNNIVF